MTINHETGFTLKCKVHFRNGQRGNKQMRQGKAPLPTPVEPGSVPRLSRLMALAIRLEGLIQRGEMQDYADLARLGLVTRARITQIMNLLNLAPDIQEEILFLPRSFKGKDLVSERDIRKIVKIKSWAKQRQLWEKLKKNNNSN